MQLSPLQSRLAASLLASFLLILLYLTLFSPQFAVAEELAVDNVGAQTLESRTLLDDGLEEEEESLRPRAAVVIDYEPEFSAFGRSIIGRAAPGVSALANNVPQALDILPGTSQTFVFEKATILGWDGERSELKKRDLGGGPQETSEPVVEEGENAGSELLRRRQSTTKAVYISANTCMQPQPVADTTTAQAPQLTMYISSALPGRTGEDSSPPDSTSHIFTEGAVMVNMDSSEDVFIRIVAPAVDGFRGKWNFEVAASIDGSYHRYTDEKATTDAGVLFLDSDSKAAVLQTREADVVNGDEGASQKPFVLFAHKGADRAIDGVRSSLCGLRNYAQIAASQEGKTFGTVQTGISRRSTGHTQFHLRGLDAGSSYSGILATAARRDTVGGGGVVYRPTQFTTRQDTGSNCALVSNLTFCDMVAYRAPSNANKLNDAALASFYDNAAKQSWVNFEKALAQIQCETSSTQRYSLVRSCSDCSRAYKDWLCHVTIPRCLDFTSTQDFLFPRNIYQAFPDGRTLSDAEKLAAASGAIPGNSNATATARSRNQAIDDVVSPGPYKELLPCDNLCYDLVQSCPSAMGFTCPLPGAKYGYQGAYQVNRTDGAGGFICNFPKAGHFAQMQSAASGVVSPPWSARGLFFLYAAGAAVLALAA